MFFNRHFYVVFIILFLIILTDLPWPVDFALFGVQLFWVINQFIEIYNGE